MRPDFFEANGTISSSYAVGDMEILWDINTANNNGQIKVKLQGMEVANHQFSPGNSQWAPSPIIFSGDNLVFSMMFLPASATANGQLTLISLILTPVSGGQITFANVTLQGWDASGAPQMF